MKPARPPLWQSWPWQIAVFPTCQQCWRELCDFQRPVLMHFVLGVWHAASLACSRESQRGNTVSKGKITPSSIQGMGNKRLNTLPCLCPFWCALFQCCWVVVVFFFCSTRWSRTPTRVWSPSGAAGTTSWWWWASRGSRESARRVWRSWSLGWLNRRWDSAAGRSLPSNKLIWMTTGRRRGAELIRLGCRSSCLTECLRKTDPGHPQLGRGGSVGGRPECWRWR